MSTSTASPVNPAAPESYNETIHLPQRYIPPHLRRKGQLATPFALNTAPLTPATSNAGSSPSEVSNSCSRTPVTPTIAACPSQVLDTKVYVGNIPIDAIGQNLGLALFATLKVIVSKPILDDSKTFHIYADFTTALDARFAIARLQRFSEPIICRNALNSDDYERADNTITSEKLGMSATAEEFLRSQGWLLNALKAEAAKHGVDVQIVVSSGSNAQAFLSDGLGNAPLPQHAESGQIAIEFAEYDKEVINEIVPTTEERIPDPAASQLSTPANKQHHFQPSLYSESSLSSFTGELTATLRPSHIEEDAQWTSLSACSVKAHNTDEMTLERASTSAASLEDDLTNDLVHTQAVLPLDASLETNAGEQNEVGLASVDTTDLVCSKTDDAEIQEGSPPSEISTSPSLAELTAALFTPLLNDTAREDEEQVVSDISSPAHVSIIENHQPLSSQAAEVELSLCETGVRRNNTPLLPSTIFGSPIAQRQLSSADLTEALIKATVADREMRASSPISTRIVTDDGHALLSRPIDPQLSSVLGDVMYGTSVTANPNPIITSEAPTVGGSPTSDLTDALLASISDEPDNVWEDLNPESPGIITGEEIEHQHIDTVALPTNPEEGKYVDGSATVEKPPVCLDIEDNFSHDLPTGLFICGCSSQAQVMETVIPTKYHQNVASIEEKLGTQYFVVCFDGPQIAKEIFDKLPQVLIETDLDKRSKGAPFVKLLQEDLPSFVGMPTAAQPVKENFTADEETTTIIVTKEGDVKTSVAVKINSGMPVGTPHKEMITSKSENNGINAPTLNDVSIFKLNLGPPILGYDDKSTFRVAPTETEILNLLDELSNLSTEDDDMR